MPKKKYVILTAIALAASMMLSACTTQSYQNNPNGSEDTSTAITSSVANAYSIDEIKAFLSQHDIDKGTFYATLPNLAPLADVRHFGSYEVEGSFRRTVEEYLGIQPIEEYENESSEKTVAYKNGCLFVDAEGMRTSDATLYDAVQNEAFAKLVLCNPDKKNGTNESHRNNPENDSSQDKDKNIDNKIRTFQSLASLVYHDLDESSDKEKHFATLNAYFILFKDEAKTEEIARTLGQKNDTQASAIFHASRTVTRNEFFEALARAVLPYSVENLDQGFSQIRKSKDPEQAIIPISERIQSIASYSYLGNSEDANETLEGSITKSEAVYLLANYLFGDYDKTLVDESLTLKNAGDIALKANFSVETDGVRKDKFQSRGYTLKYLLEGKDKSEVSSDIYAAYAFMKKVGVVKGDGSDWFERLTKIEALELMMDALIAKTKLDKTYATRTQFGKLLYPVKVAKVDLDGKPLNEEEQKEADANQGVGGFDESTDPTVIYTDDEGYAYERIELKKLFMLGAKKHGVSVSEYANDEGVKDLYNYDNAEAILKCEDVGTVAIKRSDVVEMFGEDWVSSLTSDELNEMGIYLYVPNVEITKEGTTQELGTGGEGVVQGYVPEKDSGWHPAGRPYKTTDSYGNVIYSKLPVPEDLVPHRRTWWSDLDEYPDRYIVSDEWKNYDWNEEEGTFMQWRKIVYSDGEVVETTEKVRYNGFQGF